ncbi:mariner Mos1 transposase [Trichonephila clavipes]|nr:mariner Mos1 transposase [Trichonephila clavipes]
MPDPNGFTPVSLSGQTCFQDDYHVRIKQSHYSLESGNGPVHNTTRIYTDSAITSRAALTIYTGDIINRDGSVHGIEENAYALPDFDIVIRFLYMVRWYDHPLYTWKELLIFRSLLDSVYGDSAPSLTTVKFGAAEFKRGHKSLGDYERSVHPNTATTDENIAKVHQMVLVDRRIKVRDSRGYEHVKKCVCHILNQHLGMRKLSARWMPRLLTLDQKRVRKNISNALLAQFRCNKSKFWSLLITVDETWIHHYTPETEGRTRGKWPHFKKKKILFQQDNAPSHTSVVGMAKIRELRFELRDHPPYSPDLAPSDFFLFHLLKIALGGQRISSNEEAVTSVNNYFAEKNAEYYLDGLQRREYHWEKCVELQGDYVEK